MTTVPAQRVPTSVTPPRRRDRLIAWMILLGCLVLATTAMLTDLGRSPVIYAYEADALATTVETWRRQQQFEGEPWSYERFTPHHEGLAQLSTPPARTWLQLAAIESMSDEGSLSQAIYRTRLVSVAFVLLAIAAAFWAGMSIGGVVTASMSAMICLSQPVLLYYGRLATHDAIQLGLSMLCIAAALWAIRPLRPAATLLRQALGWGICGLALGATTLAAGPNALPTVLTPIIVMLLLVPHRVGHILGLIAAILITALMVTPWAGYAHLQQPDAWRIWMATLLPQPDHSLGNLADMASLRLGWILMGVAPWTLWLIAALIQPFSTSSKGSRNRLFIGWAWFVTATLLIALAPHEATPRDVLPALVAASVLIGQLFRHGKDLSAEGRHARFWRWLRWPQWLAMLALSLLLPAMGVFQSWLIEQAWLADPIFVEMHESFWIGLCIVLVGILIVSLRFVIKHYPARALVCWAIWSAVLFAVLMFPLSQDPAATTPAKQQGQHLASIISEHPILYLTDQPRPDPVMMFYTDRVFAPVTTPQMHQLAEQDLDLYLLAPNTFDPGIPGVPGVRVPGGKTSGGVWGRLYHDADQNFMLWQRLTSKEESP